MVRFIFMWVIISAVLGGFTYLLNRKEKKTVREMGWKVAISAVAGAVITASLMSLNHVQGV